MTKSFGDFEGGRLTYWPNDDGRMLLQDLRERDGVTVDTRQNYTLFDGRRAHRVEAFTGGDRYSLVFFSVHAWTTGPRDELPVVVYPTDASLRYFSNLIAPARGTDGSILAAFGRQPKPQIICWPRTSLNHLPVSALRGIATFVRHKRPLHAVSRCFASALLSRKKAQSKAKKKSRAIKTIVALTSTVRR